MYIHSWMLIHNVNETKRIDGLLKKFFGHNILLMCLRPESNDGLAAIYIDVLSNNKTNRVLWLQLK